MLKWIVGAVLTVMLVAGLLAFEPWRLWTSSTIDEALPTVASDAADASDTGPTTASSGTQGSGDGRGRGARGQDAPRPPAPVQVQPTELAAGDFEDAEHATSGRARVIELADGSRFVRLEGLDTSDGPDLYVGLSDAPSGGSWGSYDDGRYHDLGALKATRGNQNYEIPADVDLEGLASVVIWCDRFNVAFGTAPVRL